MSTLIAINFFLLSDKTNSLNKFCLKRFYKHNLFNRYLINVIGKKFIAPKICKSFAIFKSGGTLHYLVATLNLHSNPVRTFTYITVIHLFSISYPVSCTQSFYLVLIKIKIQLGIFFTLSLSYLLLITGLHHFEGTGTIVSPGLRDNIFQFLFPWALANSQH